GRVNPAGGGGGVTGGGGGGVGRGEARILALIDELGLSTFKTYAEGETISLRNGVRQTAAGAVPPFSEAALADFVQVLTTLEEMAATVPPEAPWTAPNAIAWDATTFGQWLDANVQTDETKGLLPLGLPLAGGEGPQHARP